SILALLAALAMAGCSSASGRPAAPTPQAEASSQRARPGDGLKPFEELVKGSVARRGFFDTYEKAENLYLAVPKERLGEDFLMNFEISRGIGAGGLFGGTMLNIFEANIVAFERHGDRIYLVQRPHRFVAPNDPAAAKAVELTFGESVLASAKIESIRDDSAVVFDIYGWILSDLSGVGEVVNRAISRPGQQNRATFDRERSWLESVKAFPENVNIRAKLTFRPPQPAPLPSVPDGRYIPVSVHYSFAKLPERPMKPRLADDRVGYFMTVHKDFSNDDGRDFFVRYVNRWRLEPKGPPGPDGLVEPV